MRLTFTAGAQRALARAARWKLNSAESISFDADEIQPAALLCGLLEEPECRAAKLLAAASVDLSQVRAQWPMLRHDTTAVVNFAPPRCADELQQGFAEVALRRSHEREPRLLATEHLLWGLTLIGHDTSRWLMQHGIEPEQLQPGIEQAAGQTWNDVPLDIPVDEKSQASRERERPVFSASETTTPVADAPGTSTIVLRIIDAATNRAREGLRVIEDYVRFALDDALLTREWKQLRHELQAALEPWSSRERLAARETSADVGTQISTPSELQRADVAQLLAANFSRVQESLRSLEEYAKLTHPVQSQQFEQLRYRTYTLHRATESARHGKVDWAHARLYVLIDGRATPDEFATLAQAVIAGGADVVQLRDKQLDDRTLLARARQLRELTVGTPTRFIMNDRPDLAVLAEADGVHVGQEELTVKDARRIVGPRAVIGVSTHSLVQARQAALDGADYIGVGPTFPSPTKSFTSFTGLELLREVAAEVSLPAFAIGGITLDNLEQVLAAGFQRVAIASAITCAADISATTQTFRERLTPK